MKNLCFFCFAILLLSCSDSRVDKIIVPKLEANFYTKALSRINSDLESDPDNSKLIDQKLYYCDQLDWPTTCISALDSYKNQQGMTNQLVEQYIAYYSRHERYQLLVNIIERWSEEYDLKEKFHQPLIEALVQSDKRSRASVELRSYMINRNELEDYVFASRQYLNLKDTIMSSYYLGKVYEMDSSNELMKDYGQLLVALGFDKQGFEILDHIVTTGNVDNEFNKELAFLYATNNNLSRAISLLKPFTEDDTVSYSIVDWYIKDQKWDSAIIVINKVIERDSLNTKAIWKKARLYEDRGWLATSLTYFNSILDVQPEDTITRNRIDLIQRKIAYLQRKKFEESKIQIKEIEPIKINQ